jgi:two-component system NtrC family response regulator
LKATLLIVDDDEGIRTQMKWALAPDYTIVQAEDRPSAVLAFQQHKPLVVLLDLGLPPNPGDSQEGLATLAEVLGLESRAKIIIITGQSDKEKALMAIGRGAYDFLCKPVQMEELKIILARAVYVAQLEREYQQIQATQSPDTFEGMLGISPDMLEVFNTIRKVAVSDAPVLIMGDSGTGKEMAAQAIHRRSNRKEGPFVPINCAAIPETLLESELFGHEKGSFTGAHSSRLGRIETAAQGTLFLDEIGDLPVLLQVKLLRFLQEQTIERVGGRKTIPIDTRVIAATNIDLKQAIEVGRFRMDLYYRLAVVTIRIPPLRERLGDVEMLAKGFLKRFAAQDRKAPGRFSPQAWQALLRHTWPGNVRELENRIKRAVIMAEEGQISAADLELASLGGDSAIHTLKQARENTERQLILEALQRHRGKIAPAAADLDISRPAMYDLMAKLGIQRPEIAADKS